MNIPNLEETVEIVSKWIGCCDNQMQLNLCKDLIETFVVQRFKNHVSMIELAVHQSRLEELWLDQKVIVAASNKLQTT